MIDGKVYDTDGADEITRFTRQVDRGPLYCGGSGRWLQDHEFILYRTAGGLFFEYDTEEETIAALTGKEARAILQAQAQAPDMDELHEPEDRTDTTESVERLPEDVKQVCLWLVRGYERRKQARQNCPAGKPRISARERERMEAVEQALMAVGADIPSEDVRARLRTAILLNVESGRSYPYEQLGLTCVSRSEFYRRKDRFLADVAAYLGMA